MLNAKHLVQADKLEEIGNVNNTPPQNGDIKVYDAGLDQWVNGKRPTKTLDLGGTWGLQNNEVNGIGVTGVIDTNHTQDLGNAGAMGTPTIQTVLDSAAAGGWLVPVDMRVKRFWVNYRQNNVTAIEWGFLIFKQSQLTGVNGGAGTAILDDIEDSINRTSVAANRQTIIDVTTFKDVVISAGEMISLGARCVTTGANRNLQIRAGFIELEPA